jgi:hypothetical protein
VVVCDDPCDQEQFRLVSDGVGGAIVTWRDERGASDDIYAQGLDPNGNALWTADGIGVCTATGDQEDPSLDTDGAGGAIIAWQDYRGGLADIYAQRLDPNGDALWTANGVLAQDEGNAGEPRLISDGAGGAIFTWVDGSGNGFGVYAQRIDPNGTSIWMVDGVTVGDASGNQNDPRLTSDGAGGAIFAWEDQRVNKDIYAQRVSSGGTALWTLNGVAICTDSESQQNQQLTSDRAGGAIITWQDDRSGNDDIYAQRIDPNGSVLWTADGIAVCSATGLQQNPQITSDGAGGAVIVWEDKRSGDTNIYAQRIDADGNPLWTAGGVGVCTASGSQSGHQLISAPQGPIVTWQDYRNYGSSYWDIYSAGFWITYKLEVTCKSEKYGQVDLDPIPSDPNQPRYLVGTEVTLTADPCDGRGWKKWKIVDPEHPDDGNYTVIDTNMSTTIVMNSDREVTAVFTCSDNVSPLLPVMLGVLGLFAWARRRT